MTRTRDAIGGLSLSNAAASTPASLTLSNVAFVEAVGATSHGSAKPFLVTEAGGLLPGSRLSIADCDFRGFVAGAILVESLSGIGPLGATSSIDVRSSFFADNTGIDRDDGCCAGALTVADASDARVVILNTEFFDNEGASNGGAVRITGSPNGRFVSAVTVRGGSSFDGNSAPTGGGGLYVERSAAVTVGGQFRRNGGGAITGGAIRFLDVDVVRLSSAQFSANKAAVNAGAVHAESGYSFEVDDSDFESNSAGVGFGGALLVGDFVDVRVEDSTFVGNDADDTAGALGVTSSASLYIDDCDFEDNTADANGGAIFTAAGATLIRGSRLRRNSAAGSGGALGAAGFGSLVADDCVFEANTAVNVGGGLFGFGSGGSRISVLSSTFANHTAATGAGVAIANIGDTVIDGSNFFANAAHEFGGGVSIASSGNATVRSCAFRDNTSPTGAGGGVRASLISGSLDIEDVVFERNKAAVGGGAVLVDEVNVAYVRFSTFEENVALPDGGRGGAILAAALAQPPTRSAMRTTLSVADSSLARNNADEGGAIATDGDARRLSVVRSSLIENMARGSNGGAISNAATVLAISSCDFVQNVCFAGRGGAIYTSAIEAMAADDTTFSDHVAGIDGGAVFIGNADAPPPILTGVEFWRNGLLLAGNGFIDSDIGMASDQ